MTSRRPPHVVWVIPPGPGCIDGEVCHLLDGRLYRCPVEATCMLCKKKAVVRLPTPIIVEQPDETTHVCHPELGGCGHGFAEVLEVSGHA